MRLNKLSMLVGLTACLAAPAWAQHWSENFLSLSYGNRFAEPAIADKIAKETLTFTHISGDSLGKNFISAAVLMSDDKDPPSGGGGGAREFYGVFERDFSIGKMTGNKTGYGFAKDIYLAARLDLQTKNIDLAPRATKLRLGVGADLPVSAGFWNAGLQLWKEKNHNGIIIPGFKPTGTDVNFKVAPVLTSAWLIPVGGVGTFEGWADFVGAKGKNGFGVDTKAESHVVASFMFNVGGRESGLKLGLGAEYWNNKYGEPGVKQTTPLLIAQYKL